MKLASPYWLWAFLALPPILWVSQALTASEPRILHILVHPTGEWAARLLILTLMITPLAMLFKGSRAVSMLRRNRRYFGVASFFYAALHTVFYLADKGSMSRVLAELPRFYIWTGWLAFIIFIPLAFTSMDYFVRRMGRYWKALQRWVYPASALTLLHWASLHDWRHPAGAILHFTPLLALEAYRVAHLTRRRWARL